MPFVPFRFIAEGGDADTLDGKEGSDYMEKADYDKDEDLVVDTVEKIDGGTF